MVYNMQTSEYGMNSIFDLSTGQHKRIRINGWLWLDIVEALLTVILCNFKISWNQKTLYYT